MNIKKIFILLAILACFVLAFSSCGEEDYEYYEVTYYVDNQIYYEYEVVGTYMRQLVWNAPGNVSSAVYTPTYEVYNIDGEAYTGEKNGTSMDTSSLEGGKSHTFSVKALGDGNRIITSKEVEYFKTK